MHDSAYIASKPIDPRINKRLNIFWIGFIIYSVSYTISTSTTVNYVFCQAFQVLGLILLVPVAINLINYEIGDKYLKCIYIIYIGWLLFVILRAIQFDYEFLKRMLFNATYGALPYLAPLILLFPKDLALCKKVFRTIIWLGIFYFVCDILFIKALLDSDITNPISRDMLESFSANLSIPSAFILFTYKYHSKKQNLFAFFIILFTLAFAIIRARRTLTFLTVAIIVFAFLVYLYSNKQSIHKLVLSLLLVPFLYLYGVKVYNDNNGGAFQSISQRLDEDTRTGVEQAFYLDMNTTNWVIGKGINGTYYCPGIDLDEPTGYRGVIETGYLQIILKGGIISLSLLLLIAIPAIINGIFFSSNMLSKAAAIWILLSLIKIYPTTVDAFSLDYLIFWISVGICYSKEIRYASDNYIKDAFRARSL